MSVLEPTKAFRIGILGASFDTGNYGVNGLAEGCIRCLLQKWPNAEFTFLASGRLSRTVTLAIGSRRLDIPNFPVRFSRHVFMKNHYLVLFASGLFLKLFYGRRFRSFAARKNPYLKQLYELDIVADVTGGDSFSDIYGLRRFIQGALTKYLWMLHGKPVYFLPQTYGPFKRSWVRMVSRYLLKKAAVIWSRDRQGCEFLKGLFGASSGVQSRIQYVPDMAFVVEPEPVRDSLTEKLRAIKDAGCIIVGLNVSGLLYHGGYTQDNMFSLKADYRQLMKDITTYFIHQPNCSVLLVPHVFPPSPAYQVESDTNACRDVAGYIGQEHTDSRVLIAEDTYSHNQIKYLIGQSDFFVGSRMHACIAAMSQGIPTVGIAYSDKFTGIFESVGQTDCVVDARREMNESILSRIKNLFENRLPYREILLKQASEVKADIFTHFTNMPYKS